MALNGRFPDSLLAYLGWPEADHLRLVPAAAASLNRLAAAFEAEFGKPLYLSDAYRTYAQQVSLKIIKGTFAATPGTSNHGWGIAIDVASRVNMDNSDEHRWFEANAPSYGWINPYWAVDYNPGNGEHEPWHWEYSAARDTHPTPALEDDMNTRELLDALNTTEGQQILKRAAKGAIKDDDTLTVIADRVLAVDVGAGTLSQAVRDARVIARRTEVAVGTLPAAIIAALPPAAAGVGISLAQVEAAVKSALAALTFKSV